MKILYLLLIIILLSTNIKAEENKISDNIFNKKNLLIVSLAIANPAISLGTVAANTGTFQKLISIANISYSSIKGKSIAEEALSKTTNKNCLLKNLAEKKELCS